MSEGKSEQVVLSKYQKFNFVRKKRSEIKKAKYNPRVMTAEERQRLGDALKKHGLVQPIVINKRTDNIVGGHQRIERLDLLHSAEDGSFRDYLLDYAEVDVPFGEEVTLNLMLNNKNLSGEYDYEILPELLKIPEVDFSIAGFTDFDIECLKLNEDVASLIDPTSQENEVTEETEQELTERDKKFRKMKSKTDQSFQDYTAIDFAVTVYFESPKLKKFFKAFLDQEEDVIDFDHLRKFLKDFPDSADWMK